MLSTAIKHSCRRFFPPLLYATGMRPITPPTELVLCVVRSLAVVYRGAGFGVFKPPRNSEVLTKLRLIAN